jgi:hypothetical protein
MNCDFSAYLLLSVFLGSDSQERESSGWLIAVQVLPRQARWGSCGGGDCPCGCGSAIVFEGCELGRYSEMSTTLVESDSL